MNNPFGGTPRCATCSKPVYAAEQVIGPGRKYYHKPCLKCLSCSKRLDSFQLVEHDGEPYCKNCHLRNFSTKDLRHSNLPQAPQPASPPTSPQRSQPFPTALSPSSRQLEELASIKEQLRYSAEVPKDEEQKDIVRPVDGMTSPRAVASISSVQNSVIEEEPEGEQGAETTGSAQQSRPGSIPPKPPTLSIYSRRPISPVYSPKDLEGRPNIHDVVSPDDGSNVVSGTSDSSMPSGFQKRIVPMSTGGHGRYIPSQVLPQSTGGSYRSSGLTTNSTSTPLSPQAKVSVNHTGGVFGTSNQPLSPNFTGTPGRSPTTKFGYVYSPGPERTQCPKCQKVVYHAEQVNAIGKKWHKNCLRCTQCSALLDSTRLTEKDGDPYCRSCYSRLYGP